MHSPDTLMRTIFISLAVILCVVGHSNAAEKSLNVAVMGTTSPDPITFTGSYVVVRAGKEVKEDISGKGNRSEAFWGDYIKSCTVQRTSANGRIKLVITEGTNAVFKSEWLSTNAPIVYQRKEH